MWSSRSSTSRRDSRSRATSATPTITPTTPPAREMIVVSIRNWRMMSRRLAPMARRMPISRVRSMTLASMMFMMPMPPTSSEIDAIATITISNTRCVRRCSASSSAGETMVKSPAWRWETLSRPRRSDAADGNVGSRSHLQVDAVDLVLLLRLAVFEPEDRRVQRHVHQVVAILRRKARDIGLHGELRSGDANHLEPLLVDLHVTSDRIVGTEERRSGRFAENGNRRGAGGFTLVEEPAGDQRQVGNGRVLPGSRRTPSADPPADAGAASTA